MAEAPRDQNFVPTALFEVDGSPGEVAPGQIDEATGRILVDNASTGGDVVGPASSTDNAVARFSGTTGKLIQNSVVIIADTTGNISGAQEITLGVTGTATGKININGTTSGTVTIQSADAAGTYTLTLPTDDGDSGEFLQTNGSGVLTWAASSFNLTVGAVSNVDTILFSGATVADDTGGQVTVTIDASAEIVVANEATDTTCFPIFVTAATGDLEPKSNTSLTFNSNTADLGSTTFTAGTAFMPDADGGATLGTVGTGFSLGSFSSGATLDFANGNAVITHSSAVLTVSTGDLRVTTAGTDNASVVTVAGTQTLTNKTLTSPTITTATLSGAQQLAESASIRLDPVLSADGTYTGTTITGTAGATLAFGDIIYLAVADSRWELADASAVSTAGSVLVGFCVLAAASDGDPTVILLDGNIRADTAFPTLTVGAAAFISETSGDITNTAPTTTDSVTRVVGHALDGNTLLLNISPDWVTHV